MTTLNIRIEEETKRKAGKTLAALGLDMSSAVKLFLNQVVVEQGLPFTPTRRSPKEVRARWDAQVREALKNNKGFKTVDALMRDLEKGS